MLFTTTTIRMLIPLFLTALMVGQPLLGQDDNLSIRSIRAKKLAANWLGRKVELTMLTGESVSGEFIRANYYNFSLSSSNGVNDYAINDILAVTLNPGFVEGAIVVVAALIGGFFGSAVVSLTIENPEDVVVLGAGAVGTLGGGLFGYRNFFQKIVIHLD